MKNIIKKAFIAFIKFYQMAISPYFPACCRFRPTCSQYAITAIERFGPFKGGWMAIKRLHRCNPLFKGGYDPVPRPGDITEDKK